MAKTEINPNYLENNTIIFKPYKQPQYMLSKSVMGHMN